MSKVYMLLAFDMDLENELNWYLRSNSLKLCHLLADSSAISNLKITSKILLNINEFNDSIETGIN